MTIRDPNAPTSNLPFTPQILNLVRVAYPELLAKELVSVQPMDGTAFKELYDFLKANPDKALVFGSKNIEQDKHNGTEKESSTQGEDSKG